MFPARAIAADAAAEPDERTVISPATAAAAPPAGVISFVPGVTSPGRPAAVPGAAVPGAAESGAAGSVVPTVSAPAATPPAAPVPPAPAPASARHPSVLPDLVDQTRLSTGEKVLARLAWDDGATQAVYGRTLFGRNPVPETGAMVCPIRDETLSLSKTHFELVPDGSGTAADAGGPGGSGAVGGSGTERALWVIDRHSTNGVVIQAGNVPGYGNVVYIDHGAGTISRLAHLSKIGVTKGQTVQRGEEIGLSGGARGAPGSGRSSGPHLHYEVRVDGKPVNPMQYLEASKNVLEAPSDRTAAAD